MAINWEKVKGGNFKNGMWYDMGDMRLKLTECKDIWILSVAVRVYTKDREKSMFRPYEIVDRFEKPCSLEEARGYMGVYIERLVNGLLEYME